MSRFIIAISFLCYLVVSSGVVLNSHYCMKRLVSVHLFETSPDVCGKCGMDMHESGGCCKNEVKLVKLTQDQNKFTPVSYDIPAPAIQLHQPLSFLETHFLQEIAGTDFNNHSPPLLSKRYSYLRNSVFRI